MISETSFADETSKEMKKGDKVKITRENVQFNVECMEFMERLETEEEVARRIQE